MEKQNIPQAVFFRNFLKTFCSNSFGNSNGDFSDIFLLNLSGNIFEKFLRQLLRLFKEFFKQLFWYLFLYFRWKLLQEQFPLKISDKIFLNSFDYLFGYIPDSFCMKSDKLLRDYPANFLRKSFRIYFEYIFRIFLLNFAYATY